MSPDTIINVEGNTRNYTYREVQDSVIKLGDKFYFKDDTERLVRVSDNGKYRLFRKQSPLVVHVGGGKYVLKKDAIYTEDKVWLSKENVVYVDGKPVRSAYCTEIDGRQYMLTDKELVKCVFTRKYCLKNRAVALSPKYYDNLYSAPDQVHNLVKTCDGYIKIGDSMVLISNEGVAETVHILSIKSELINVFYRFKDETNPQADRIDLAHALSSSKHMFKHHEGLRVLIHKTMYVEIDNIYTNVIELAQREATDKIRQQINKKFSDAGPDENNAPIINPKYQTWPGKQQIYGYEGTPVLSKTLKEVGGIGYTFGVEFETSAGLLSAEQAAKIDVKAVGDRSIGAAEYVTGILHGDAGIERIKDICKMLSENTLVDDRCGLHVHIGGIAAPRVDVPDYNRNFAIQAIKLGCLIEEDLYKISPPNREPTLYHCHSIQRWKDINDKNWKDYLGSFVFGPKESWSEPFDFKLYSYGGEGRKGTNSVATWCGGRYKWLNLVHIATRSSAKTCEFRIFAGTTNFDKVYAYILTALAFVWLIENRPSLIADGMTLDKMVHEAYKKSPKTLEWLLDFFAKRREKFKRDRIYKKRIPSPYL